MARIVILTHAYDMFQRKSYLLKTLSGLWRAAGHEVTVLAGLRHWPEADVAVLHVDLSVIPAAYAEACRRYPAVVNGAALDIRKSCVSRFLVRPGDGWRGPVIVKTDLNCGGMPERRFQAVARAEGQASRPLADGPLGEITSTDRSYPILGSVDAVPSDVWQDPGLVVERFLPEQDARGYWMRAWVFLGERERCTRYLGTHPVVKSGNIIASEPAPVPESLRAERRRLGFDFGKFDFVVRDGKAILFDANRTPTAPPPGPSVEASNADLALGLETWLK